jgi:hypothetical protein
VYSKTRHPPKTGAIIVAPPWPNTGSSNIFLAQAAAHKKFGHETLLVLGSIHVSPSNYREIKELKTEMKYDGVSDVVYGATNDTKRPYLSKSFLDWILAEA